MPPPLYLLNQIKDPPVPHIFLRPHGNLGNHMLQLMTAERLAQTIPGLTYSGYSIAHWNLSKGRIRNNRPPLPRLQTQDIDLSEVARMMQAGELPLSILRAMVLQMSHYGTPDDFRGLFPPLLEPKEHFGADHLLINVRGAEILKARSPEYGPIAVEYYARLIEETGLKPVFLGQLGDDYNTKALIHRFPDARFIPSQGAAEDFETLRHAKHIVTCVSTFSWLAAWLSKAETVFQPLLGMFNPEQRPDIDLLPVNDTRYRFDLFPVRRWTASPEQLSALTEPDPSKRLSAEETQTLLVKARDNRRAARAEDLTAFKHRAARTHRWTPLLKRLYSPH